MIKISKQVWISKTKREEFVTSVYVLNFLLKIMNTKKWTNHTFKVDDQNVHSSVDLQINSDGKDTSIVKRSHLCLQKRTSKSRTKTQMFTLTLTLQGSMQAKSEASNESNKHLLSGKYLDRKIKSASTKFKLPVLSNSSSSDKKINHDAMLANKGDSSSSIGMHPLSKATTSRINDAQMPENVSNVEELQHKAMLPNKRVSGALSNIRTLNASKSRKKRQISNVEFRHKAKMANYMEESARFMQEPKKSKASIKAQLPYLFSLLQAQTSPSYRIKAVPPPPKPVQQSYTRNSSRNEVLKRFAKAGFASIALNKITFARKPRLSADSLSHRSSSPSMTTRQRSRSCSTADS